MYSRSFVIFLLQKKHNLSLIAVDNGDPNTIHGRGMGQLRDWNWRLCQPKYLLCVASKFTYNIL